jgi:hypothetical protein
MVKWPSPGSLVVSIGPRKDFRDVDDGTPHDDPTLNVTCSRFIRNWDDDWQRRHISTPIGTGEQSLWQDHAASCNQPCLECCGERRADAV